MKLIIFLLASCLSAFLYRRGGTNKGTLWRDIGCSLVMTLILGFYFKWTWLLIPCFGLCWAACSTYWDWVLKEDNIWVHSFFLGLSIFPLGFIGLSWWFIGIRCVVMAIFLGGLNVWLNHNNNPFPQTWRDELEEFSRGFLLIATLFYM